MSNMDMYFYEKEALNEGYNLICGVDEAGRGPLAGPVFAAAVILDNKVIIEGLNDSKKLSEKKRNYFFDVIKDKAICYSVALASEAEIDNINILNATMLAMKRAIDGLYIKPDIALIDGNKAPELSIKSKTIIKGDALSASIAAASILAKVSRDNYMRQMAEIYPEYSFEKHKGYGTKLHIELLKKYSPCKIHRKSFLKKLITE